MAPRLPPDLERVGDDLVAGVERALAARRRRRRVIIHGALTGVAALTAAAAFVPATLGPGGPGSPGRVATPAGEALAALHLHAVPAACDLPVGGRLERMPACAPATRNPVPLGRPGRW